MDPQDLANCREIHAGLMAKERNSINYLFLEPVETTYFPEYLNVIKKPMDLRTLKENLEAGKYARKEEFYADAQLIFDNAITFNKDRDSKFVVDLAKRMIRAFDRLKKKTEAATAKRNGGGDSSTAASTSAASGGGGSKKIKLKLKRNNSILSTSSSTEEATSGTGAGDAAGPPPTKKAKKVKLKLSLGKSSSKSSDSKSSRSNSPASPIVETVSDAPMNATRRAQCYKIISSFKRRQPTNSKWFLKPINDPMIVKDYKEKIANPVDLGAITSKLDKNQYSTVAEFVLDLRRICSNCLQYNTTIDDSFRPIANECLTTMEQLCKFFIGKVESPKIVYPRPLYCWEECLKVIDALLKTKNPDDGYQTAHFFLQPVSFFCGGQWPHGYLDKVQKPMDYGTIMQNLITGVYDTAEKFAADCRLVTSNCRSFYEGTEDGPVFMEKVNRLEQALQKQLAQLSAYDKSDKGAKAREKARTKLLTIKKPEQAFLKDILRDLRATTYTDKSAKITEKATLHFEKPVDTSIFTDYPKFVDTPMDLETVERKIGSDAYATPEDFEYDILTIFRNCDKYNTPKKNFHMVTLGKHTAKVFRKMFAQRLRPAERSGSVTKRALVLPSAAAGKKILAGKKRPPSPSVEEKQPKRVSIKGPSRSNSGASKSVPSIAPSTAGKVAPKSKSGGKKMAPKMAPKIAPKQSKITVTDPNAPIPMHVAIASIKEAYPGRRQIKDLEGFEAECLKFLKTLIRHPWVSAERPKYIFHVPVHIIFPEIRDSYAAKIKHPMDLTTAEAKLLQGAYQTAEEFITDISLVFSNAIEFNKDGHEIGEPMSCAYYEAATHLLKYSRWLSLEVLESCIVDCTDSPIVERGAASNWKLTKRNAEMARKEMEQTVFNELIDKTEPGDTRYSWHEQECDKLLKALMHTSDRKHMSFFIQMIFPANYSMYISKPIAWDLCYEKLRERKYNSIGETVADLRLIFSNALKYNEKAREVDKVSAVAYDSAIHMSAKLEAAIDRMLLTVGDRIGRERIDMMNTHRRQEAEERAREEAMKLQWEKEHPGTTMEVKTKLRITHRGSNYRKRPTDFDLPFFDEEDDNEESHADTVSNAKALYEKQLKKRAAMRKMSISIGISVFKRLEERAAAKAWAYQMAEKAHLERVRVQKEKEARKRAKAEEDKGKPKGSLVSAALKSVDRKQIKLALDLKPIKPKKRKKMLSSF